MLNIAFALMVLNLFEISYYYISKFNVLISSKMKNIDKRIRYAIGITFIMGSLFGGLIGYDLKNIGQQYNHIWALSIIALYAGFDWISKAMRD